MPQLGATLARRRRGRAKRPGNPKGAPPEYRLIVECGADGGGLEGRDDLGRNVWRDEASVVLERDEFPVSLGTARYPIGPVSCGSTSNAKFAF